MALVVRALKDQLAAQPDRLVNGLLTAGVWKPSGSFEVSAPGGMFVAVGSGTEGDLAVVEGSAARQGTYIVENPDGTIPGNIAIAPGDASDPRVDLIVLTVYDDDADSSGQTDAVVEVVEGTPATTPSAPSVPDSSIALAEVEVSAGESTAIVTGDITDARTFCQVRGSGADASDDADLVPLSHMRDYVDEVGSRRLYREVLASAAGSVTIEDADIDGSFADWAELEIRVLGQIDSANDNRNVFIWFNGDSTGNYDFQQMRADGTTPVGVQASSTANSSLFRLPADNGLSTALGIGKASIMAHDRSGVRTVWVGKSYALWASAGQSVDVTGGEWRQTGVVTSITLVAQTGDFVAGTEVTIRGVA